MEYNVTIYNKDVFLIRSLHYTLFNIDTDASRANLQTYYSCGYF